MQFRLRTLLIVLAVGLVLVELGLFMLPDSINLPGGMAGWVVFMFLFWRGIPALLSITLVAIAVVTLPRRTF
jgi:hypothetical protein